MKFLMIAFLFIGCSSQHNSIDSYTVEYKLSHALFWSKQDNVKGDLLPQDLKNVRVLILNDESRVEIPLDGTLFVFSKERFLIIKKGMEKETNQSLRLGQ